MLAPGEQINSQLKFENNFSILQFIVYNHFKLNQNINKIFDDDDDDILFTLSNNI